jgi:DNA-binding transcriptional LysR family regulator
MDRLLSMRVFYRVALAGNFSRAATELGLSNAVVSRLVADLEEHLNTRLLNRSTRSVNLTEAGKEYLKRCESILESIDEAEAPYRGDDPVPRGRLRLLVSFTEGLCVLVHHLAEFRARYPHIQLDIELAEQVVDIVDRQFDLAIQPQTFIYSNSVVVRELMTGKLILCASPDYIKRCGMPENPEDLNEREGITLSDPRFRDYWLLQSPTRQVRVQPNHILMSNNLIPIIGGIGSGLGIGIVFENVVQSELEEGSLVRVLPDYYVETLSYFIVYPSRKHLSNKVRVMVDFLLEAFNPQNVGFLSKLRF